VDVFLCYHNKVICFLCRQCPHFSFYPQVISKPIFKITFLILFLQLWFCFIAPKLQTLINYEEYHLLRYNAV
jgi:hypothetical protein